VSRAQLIAAAKAIGVETVARGRGYAAPKTADALRVDILERCLGPNLGMQNYGSSTQADIAIARAVDCASGKLGYLLQTSQYCIRMANTDRTELGRLSTLKRRRPADEARMIKSARQWLEIAKIAQDLHSMEAGLAQREAA
jgi:hypothetical protein